MLGLLGFFDAAFLGCIRCVPFLALEGDLSFCVTLAAFADTGALSTCSLLLCPDCKSKGSCTLRCPMRVAEDIIFSLRRR